MHLIMIRCLLLKHVFTHASDKDQHQHHFLGRMRYVMPIVKMRLNRLSSHLVDVFFMHGRCRGGCSCLWPQRGRKLARATCRTSVSVDWIPSLCVCVCVWPAATVAQLTCCLVYNNSSKIMLDKVSSHVQTCMCFEAHGHETCCFFM